MTQFSQCRSTAKRAACAVLMAGAITFPAFAESIYPDIFAGGISGVSALQSPSNSKNYREDGGGVYLHHSAWALLSGEAKAKILNTFSGKQVAVEIGYGPQWHNVYLTQYHARGVRPRFVTANAFAKGNVPDPAQWADFVDAFYAAGVDRRTLILPTFEYANFGPNLATLQSNTVSQRADFQAIIKKSGGITLDTPSSYFFAREEGYRRWVIDAIRWTHNQGLAVVVIMSPNTARYAYASKSRLYLDYLKAHGAMPDIFAIENYTFQDPATYPNTVGNENSENTQLGVARLLQTRWLPDVLGRAGDVDGDGVKAADEPGLNRSDFDVRDFGFKFDRAGDFHGWTSDRNITDLKVTNGSLSGRTFTADPGIGIRNLHVNGGIVRDLQIQMRASKPGSVQVYFGTDGGAIAPDNVVTAKYDTPDTWQVVTIPMASHPRWKNHDIFALRIDPISAANATFEIAQIRGAGLGFGMRTLPFNFDSPGDLKGWSNARNIVNLGVANGSLNGTTTTADGHVQVDDISIDGDHVEDLYITMKASAAGSVQVYFGVDGGAIGSNNVVSATYKTPNTWQLVRVPMSTHPNWKNHRISTLRIDPVTVTNATFAIQSIRGVER